MSCLSLLIQVTHFVHLIHILKRANHLICILGNMCDIFRYQFYINISRFAIAIRYSLLAIRYSLLAIRYSLLAIRYSRQTLFSSEAVVYL